jgi:hypothetical protein
VKPGSGTFDLQRRRLLGGLAAGAALSAVGAPALAHRAHVTLTRVLANARAGTWEFIHSVHIHDAITALSAWLPGEDPNPATDRARARLALEVERRMAWSGPDGTRLAPQMVGAELAGDDVAVYQEMPAPRAAGDYRLACTLLHDVFGDQRNTVQFSVVDPPIVARLDAKRTQASFRWTP